MADPEVPTWAELNAVLTPPPCLTCDNCPRLAAQRAAMNAGRTTPTPRTPKPPPAHPWRQWYG